MSAQALTKRPVKPDDLAFRAIDTNGNGYIEAAELRAALMHADSRRAVPTEAEVTDMLRSLDKDGDGRLDRHEFQELCKREAMTVHGQRGSALDDMTVQRLAELSEDRDSLKLRYGKVNLCLGTDRVALSSTKDDYGKHFLPKPPGSARDLARMHLKENYLTGVSPREFDTTSGAHSHLVPDPNPRVWKRSEKTKSSVWQHDGSDAPWSSSARLAYRPAPPQQLRQGTDPLRHRGASWRAGDSGHDWQTTAGSYGSNAAGHKVGDELARNRAALQQSSLVFGNAHTWQTTNRDNFALPALSPRCVADDRNKRVAVFFGGCPRDYKTTNRGAFKGHRFVTRRSMSETERAEIAYDLSPRSTRSALAGAATARH
eukprot:TRINITY_DN46803_c0_g1_i1.p1 TRINITY_DN46803_c0_g1~~TRINITY_DN46803_c0_g1_i1.p1  ORF type:complete len:400 (+),score=133.52 TRINITY_DN46803_c0_g1_i1:87-1202(+)